MLRDTELAGLARTLGNDTNLTPDDCTGPDSSHDKAPKPTHQEIEQIINSGRSDYGDQSSALQLAARTPQETLQAVPMFPAVQRVTQPDRYSEPLDPAEAIATTSRLRSQLLNLLQGRQRRAHAAGTSGRRIDQRRLVKIAYRLLTI